MALCKAVKMEVMIVCENGLSDEDVVQWTKNAMRDYCEFDESIVNIIESHSNVIGNFEDGPKN